MRALRLALCSVLTVALPEPAFAQEPPRTKEDAQLLFDEGLSYMLKGELKVGCAFIKQSLDVDPRPGTIFTLAECYSRAGKFASAVEYYDEYLNVYSRLPPEDQDRQRTRAAVSSQERSKLVKSVPWITVSLPDGAPPGVFVTMDDEPFPTSLFGVAIAVDPGKHWFTARTPGGPLARTELSVEPGTRRTHVLELHDASAAEPADATEPSRPEDGDTGLPPLFFVLGGIGIAGVATATVTGIMLVDLASGIRDQCEQTDGDSFACGPRDDAAARRAVDDARLAQDTLGPINTISIAVGVAGLGAAAIVFLTRGDPDGASDPGVTASATVSPGAGAVQVSGRF